MKSSILPVTLALGLALAAMGSASAQSADAPPAAPQATTVYVPQLPSATQ
jgi:hypothetical protein